MSAGKPKHDYHLVDPSPWPIYVSFATLVLAFGAVYYFHSKALWLLLIGFALVVYGAFMWWRDVIEEAEHQGHHTPIVQIGHRYGMPLFIASEVMFFVAWFGLFLMQVYSHQIQLAVYGHQQIYKLLILGIYH